MLDFHRQAEFNRFAHVFAIQMPLGVRVPFAIACDTVVEGDEMDVTGEEGMRVPFAIAGCAEEIEVVEEIGWRLPFAIAGEPAPAVVCDRPCLFSGSLF